VHFAVAYLPADADTDVLGVEVPEWTAYDGALNDLEPVGCRDARAL